MKKYLSYLPNSISAIVLAIIGYFGILYSLIAITFASDAISAILKGKTEFPNPEEGIYLSELNEPLTFGLFFYLFVFIIFIILIKEEYKNTTQQQNDNNILKTLFIQIGFLLFFLQWFIIIYIEGHYLLNFIRG